MGPEKNANGYGRQSECPLSSDASLAIPDGSRGNFSQSSGLSFAQGWTSLVNWYVPVVFYHIPDCWLTYNAKLLLLDQMSLPESPDFAHETSQTLQHQLYYSGEILEIAFDSLKGYKEQSIA